MPLKATDIKKPLTVCKEAISKPLRISGVSKSLWWWLESSTLSWLPPWVPFTLSEEFFTLTDISAVPKIVWWEL